jgi:large subunit ribosomal protein L32
MALPTQKRSKSRKKRRQYQFRLSKIQISSCPKCKKPVLPHRICPFCGYYASKEKVKK